MPGDLGAEEKTVIPVMLANPICRIFSMHEAF
jgi:hypothetical protein